MAEIIVGVTLTKTDCGLCGGVYAITESYRLQCYEQGTGWTCPYCKASWGYFGDTAVKRLERELAKSRAAHDQTRAECDRQRELKLRTERRLKAQKGVTTRIKNRVRRGVCPCCNRYFENLQRHMESKHADYAASEDAQ